MCRDREARALLTSCVFSAHEVCDKYTRNWEAKGLGSFKFVTAELASSRFAGILVIERVQVCRKYFGAQELIGIVTVFR